MGYDDLGQHYHRTGNLVDSSKAFHRERDVCTTSTHIVIMYIRLITVSIDQGSWFAVQSHVQRIRSSSQKHPDAERINAKATAANGLANLCLGAYKDAATNFLDTDPRLAFAKSDDSLDEESFNEVLTPNDIAVYGGLCALASMSRDELQKRVLDNSPFRNFLELEPHIRRAVSLFVSSKFSACLAILDAYRSDYLLDLHLQNHVGPLYFLIRSKAIRQHFVPFSRVTLANLAVAFNTDETAIEHELTAMIQRGTLDARIDLVDRVLVANAVDARVSVHEDALATAQEYYRTAHQRILRMEISRAKLEVKAGRSKAGTGTLSTNADGDFVDPNGDAVMGGLGPGRAGLRSGAKLDRGD